MAYESLDGNTNAEKWGEEDAIAFLEKAIDAAKKKKFDFIGEVANELDTYREVFPYLKGKFDSCVSLYNRLNQVCEANCFSHGKKGEIVPSLAIMNLKSNHHWTDRIDTTTKDEAINMTAAERKRYEELKAKRNVAN